MRKNTPLRPGSWLVPLRVHSEAEAQILSRVLRIAPLMRVHADVLVLDILKRAIIIRNLMLPMPLNFTHHLHHHHRPPFLCSLLFLLLSFIAYCSALLGHSTWSDFRNMARGFPVSGGHYLDYSRLRRFKFACSQKKYYSLIP